LTSHATLNGNITATGGENCDQRGFEWGTTQGGPYPNSWTENGSFGTGAFSHQVTGLGEETLFYYRAKAHNTDGGWGYGGEQSFTTWGGKNVSDSGTGTEALDVSDTVGPTDSGAGSESLVIDEGEIINISDSAAGSDVLTSVDDAVGASDNASSSDAAQIEEDMLPITDSGTGSDAASAADGILISDSAVGTETTDEWEEYSITDEGLGIDTTYLVQGRVTLDDIALPHVLNITIEEPSIFQDLPIMDGLPYRKQYGKQGRSLRIQGWTDSLSTLETLRGYDDGEKHLLVLPTGDSMSVHVTDALTPENVEDYDRYDYTLVAVEVVD
jgi:hypothetical protein